MKRKYDRRSRPDSIRTLAKILKVAVGWAYGLSKKYGADRAKLYLHMAIDDVAEIKDAPAVPARERTREAPRRAKRAVTVVAISGSETATIRELADRCGISYDAMRKRLKRLGPDRAVGPRSRRTGGGRPADPESMSSLAKRAGVSRQWACVRTKRHGPERAREMLLAMIEQRERQWTQNTTEPSASSDAFTKSV